jgi:hypothetical protein
LSFCALDSASSIVGVGVLCVASVIFFVGQSVRFLTLRFRWRVVFCSWLDVHELSLDSMSSDASAGVSRFMNRVCSGVIRVARFVGRECSGTCVAFSVVDRPSWIH